MALFDVTICKTTQKWQKEGHFTTPVPVEPKLYTVWDLDEQTKVKWGQVYY